MTDWELINVLFRPGDTGQAKKGIYDPVANKERESVYMTVKRKKQVKKTALLREAPAPASGYQAVFYETWRRRGLSEPEIAAKFAEAKARGN